MGLPKTLTSLRWGRELSLMAEEFQEAFLRLMAIHSPSVLIFFGGDGALDANVLIDGAVGADFVGLTQADPTDDIQV